MMDLFAASADIMMNGGGSAVIKPITITENGSYTASEGVDGFNPIDVKVNNVYSDIIDIVDQMKTQCTYTAGEYIFDFKVDENPIYLSYVSNDLSGSGGALGAGYMCLWCLCKKGGKNLFAVRSNIEGAPPARRYYSWSGTLESYTTYKGGADGVTISNVRPYGTGNGFYLDISYRTEYHQSGSSDVGGESFNLSNCLFQLYGSDRGSRPYHRPLFILNVTEPEFMIEWYKMANTLKDLAT